MSDDNKKPEFKKKNTPLDLIFAPNKEDQGNVGTEDVSKIITEWLNLKHIKTKTRLTKQQVISIAVLQSLADTYNIKILKRFLKEFRISKLSEEGKTSSELENILKNRTNIDETGHLKSLAKFLE